MAVLAVRVLPPAAVLRKFPSKHLALLPNVIPLYVMRVVFAQSWLALSAF